MADNKNIVDDVLSKGIFGKVATKYTSRASKEEVVKEAVEELPPVVEQPEPVTVEPEPAVIEQVIAVKPVKFHIPPKQCYRLWCHILLDSLQSCWFFHLDFS